MNASLSNPVVLSSILSSPRPWPLLWSSSTSRSSARRPYLVSACSKNAIFESSARRICMSMVTFYWLVFARSIFARRKAEIISTIRPVNFSTWRKLFAWWVSVCACFAAKFSGERCKKASVEIGLTSQMQGSRKQSKCWVQRQGVPSQTKEKNL